MADNSSQWQVVSEEDAPQSKAADSGWEVVAEEDSSPKAATALNQDEADNEINRVTSGKSPFKQPTLSTLPSPEAGPKPAAAKDDFATRQLTERAEQMHGAPLKPGQRDIAVGISQPQYLPKTEEQTVSSPQGPQIQPKEVSTLTGEDKGDNDVSLSPYVNDQGGDPAASEKAGEAYLKQGPGQIIRGVGHMAEGEFGSDMTPDDRTAERYTGGSEILRGAGTTLLPAAPFAAAAAPISTAVGLGTGLVAQKAAGAIANWANLTPEEKQFWQDFGFFVPSIMGAASGARGEFSSGEEGTAVGASALGDRVAVGAAKTDQGVTIGAKVGGKVFSRTFGGVQEPSQAGIEPQTIEGNPGAVGQDVMPQSAAAAEAKANVAEAVQAEARNQAADEVASGIRKPPVANLPEPPVKDVPQAHMGTELWDNITSHVADLPEAERNQAVLDIHDRLTKWMLGNGKVIGPDGQVHVVQDQKAADKLASTWINDKLAQVDEAKVQAQKDFEKQSVESAKQQKEAKAQQAQTDAEAKDYWEVVREESHPTDNKRGTQEAPATQEPASASKPVATAESTEAPESFKEAEQPKEETAIAKPEPQKFSKGDNVDFTDNDGNPQTGTIKYVNPNGMVVRLQTDDGKKQEVSPSKIRGLAERGTTEPSSDQLLTPKAEAAETSKQSESTIPTVTPVKGAGDNSTQPEDTPAGADNALIEHINKHDWWHVPVVDANSYAERGKFLSSSYKDAEFYGRPNDKPERASVSNPIVGDEQTVERELLGRVESTSLPESGNDDFLRARFALDKKLHDAARDKGYDAIAILAPKAFADYKSSGKIPRSVELNVVNKPALGKGTTALKDEPKYKFGSTQHNIAADSEAAQSLQAARARISPGDLAGDGKDIGDGGNHVTVRYGIQGDDTEGIKKYLSQQAPFEATLGKTEAFKPSEHSDGAAPIIAPVESPELHRMNAELEQHGDFTEPSFKEYRPHATVGYVKPDKAGRYTGMSVTDGKKFTVDHVAITDRNGGQQVVKLEGKKEKNAVSERSAGAVGPHPGGGEGTRGGEQSQGVGPSQQGQATSGEGEPSSQTSKQEKTPSVGKPAPGAPSERYRIISPRQVVADPLRFQWRAVPRRTISESAPWDQDLAGPVDIWRDPKDEKWYVVEGHHRLEHAKRTGVPFIEARTHEFKNAEQAKQWGAANNIRLGNAEPFDAALYFRQTGETPEKLEAAGIRLAGKTAEQGAALARLSEPLWEQYRTGELDEAKAVAIGKHVSNPDIQKELAVEAKRSRLSASELDNLARQAATQGTTDNQTLGLFGSETSSKSNAVAVARVSAQVERMLSEDKTAFRAVANEARAKILSRARNIIDVEGSSQQKVLAQALAEGFQRVQNRAGEVHNLLTEAASKVTAGANRNDTINEFYPRIRAALIREIGAGSGLPDTSARPARGSDGGSSSDAGGGAEEANAGEGVDQTPLFRAASPAPPFYLKSERLIAEKMPNRASAGSVLSILKNNGVKEDELKWTGLDDYLKTKAFFTKPEIENYLKANQVEVKDVLKGDIPKVHLPSLSIREDEHSYVAVDNKGLNWGEVGKGVVANKDEARQYLESYIRRRENERAKERNAKSLTKFGNHVLPGGENYRELLLTLPSADKPITELAPGMKVIRTSNGEYWTADDNGNDVTRNEYGDQHTYPTPEEAKSAAIKAMNDGPFARKYAQSDTSSFRDGHFGEPNVLAHVRFNDRTDAEGKRVLFMEELQSDWHQKGRRQGYKTGAEEKFEQLKAAIEQKHGKSLVDLRIEQSHAEPNPSPTVSADLAAIDAAYQAAQDEKHGNVVPDAPFKKDWHEMALRRMLRYAAENGYDQLAWTTGEQQAERYDLSKRISQVSYSGSNLKAWDLDGKEVIGTTGITPQQLPDYIGKEAAEKLMAQEPQGTLRTISGLDLKVGGSGMKGFYDKIIPDYLNKYGKKWGAKVGEAKIATRHPDENIERFEKDPDSGRWQVLLKNGTKWGSFASSAQAKREYDAVFGKSSGGTPVHSLPITESMKQSVMDEGQPLFRRMDVPERTGLISQNAAKSQHKLRTAEGRIPARIEANREAIGIVSAMVGNHVLGIAIPPANVAWTSNQLGAYAGLLEKHGDVAGAAGLKGLARSIRLAGSLNGDAGVPIIGVQHEHVFSAIAEELFHSIIQMRPAGGDIRKGVPWQQLADSPVLAKMRPILQEEHGDDEAVIAAEAIVDVWLGEYDRYGVSPSEAADLARAYFSNVPASVADDEEKLAAFLKNRYKLEVAGGSNGEVRNAIRQARKTALRSTSGDGEGRRGSAEDRSGDRAEDSNKPGEPLTRKPESGELESWVNGSRAVTVSESGDQTDLFGEPTKMYEVAKTDKNGDTASRLVTQAQLDRALLSPRFRSAVEAGRRNGLFGQQDLNTAILGDKAQPSITLPPQGSDDQPALFRKDEEMTFGMSIPGIGEAADVAGRLISKAAEPVKEYVQNEVERNREARDIQEGIYDLESQYAADVLRTVQLLKKVPGTPEDEEAIYHWMENQSEPLAPVQRDVYDNWISPIEAENQRIYSKLTDGGAPVENYVHRIVKQSGSLLDRMIAGKRTTGRGNILTKSASATKSRTMMALEADGGPLRAGRRVVVSIKGGRITKIANGEPDDLGPLASGMTTRYELQDEKLSKIADTIIDLQKQIKSLPSEDREYQVARIDAKIAKLKVERQTVDRLNKQQGTEFATGNASDDAARLQKQREVLSSTPDDQLKLSLPGRTKLRKLNEAMTVAKNQRSRALEAVPTEHLLDELWMDKNGKKWRIRQATTKEIEANTDLRYYHNALASTAANYLQLRKAERAFDFLEGLKNSPEFSSIAAKTGGRGGIPDGWQTVRLPQFHGYVFEPHTAEVLNWYADRLDKGGSDVYGKIGGFLRTAIFFNPLIHTPNLLNHWTVEKGATGFSPHKWPAGTRSMVRAVNAVIHQNRDYLAALDAGAPLQSHREATSQLADLVLKTLGADEQAISPIAKLLGYVNPANLVKPIYKFSGKVTWVSNDVLFMQSVYEKMEQGMGLKDAINETGRHIPTYRIPVRVLNSARLGKLMNNPDLAMFSAYHYGALRSYGEMAKSALGLHEPPEMWNGGSGQPPEPPDSASGGNDSEAGDEGQGGAGNAKMREVLHGWELLVWLGLITFVAYPLLDRLAKKLSGNEDAEVRRAGASTLPGNLVKLAKGEKDVPAVVESIVTPAVFTKNLIELALNRDTRTGQHIYNQHAHPEVIAKQVGRKAGEMVSPVSMGAKVWEDPDQWKKTMWGLMSVNFPKHGASKIAAEIALDHMSAAAEDPDEREHMLLKRAALESARKGDYEPMMEAREKGLISTKEYRSVRRNSMRDPLVATVSRPDFTVQDVLTVYKAATPEERETLDPVLHQKLRALAKQNRDKADEAQEEADSY